MTIEFVEPVCLAFYPWYCHAIRGHSLVWIRSILQMIDEAKDRKLWTEISTACDAIPYFSVHIFLSKSASRIRSRRRIDQPVHSWFAVIGSDAGSFAPFFVPSPIRLRYAHGVCLAQVVDRTGEFNDAH